VQRVAGQPLVIREEARRKGDPPTLVARAERIRSLLGWVPRLDQLDVIVESSLRWEEKFKRNPW
jgi:UDP-glucose 4-epimerase